MRLQPTRAKDGERIEIHADFVDLEFRVNLPCDSARCFDQPLGMVKQRHLGREVIPDLLSAKTRNTHTGPTFLG